MRRAGILLIVSGLCLAGAAHAQSDSTFAVSLLGGFAGNLEDQNGGFGHTAWQAGFAMATDLRTYTTLRVGRMSLGDESVPGLTGATLDYVVVGGEYRFEKAAYDTGLFVGLGGYRLDGDPFLAGTADRETALGIELGFTGDFDVSEHLSLMAEVGFHYAFLEEIQLYGEALGGVAIHF